MTNDLNFKSKISMKPSPLKFLSKGKVPRRIIISYPDSFAEIDQDTKDSYLEFIVESNFRKRDNVNLSEEYIQKLIDQKCSTKNIEENDLKKSNINKEWYI